LVQFLVAFGNLVGRSAYFTAEAAEHPTNLFAVLVRLSSKGRKGSSWEQILRLLEQVDEEWAQNRVQSGLSSGEGLIWAVRDAITKEKPIKSRRPGGCTRYETVIDDPGVSDKRLLIQEPEFAQVLKVMQREGNTLSPLIRQAWDRGNLRTLTKNNPAKSTRAHISIVGHVTREEVRRYLAETEMANGFGNRFLWVAVRRSKSLPFGGGRVDYGSLLGPLRRAARFAKGCNELTRNKLADLHWKRAYEALSEGRPGLLGAMLGRAEAQVMRLAVLYALLDRSRQINHRHLCAALELWGYCERSARFIFGDSLGNHEIDRLLAAIRAAAGGLTRSQIYSDVFRRNTSKEVIRSLLGQLLELDLVRRETDPHHGPGQPVERWFAR
jgi:hypothetical protein